MMRLVFRLYQRCSLINKGSVCFSMVLNPQGQTPTPRLIISGPSHPMLICHFRGPEPLLYLDLLGQRRRSGVSGLLLLVSLCGTSVSADGESG